MKTLSPVWRRLRRTFAFARSCWMSSDSESVKKPVSEGSGMKAPDLPSGSSGSTGSGAPETAGAMEVCAEASAMTSWARERSFCCSGVSW